MAIESSGNYVDLVGRIPVVVTVDLETREIQSVTVVDEDPIEYDAKQDQHWTRIRKAKTIIGECEDWPAWEFGF